MNAIGVDLGGTWIRGALVDENGLSSDVIRRETKSSRPAEAILDDIIGLITQLEKSSNNNVSTIGIGVPTTLNDEDRLAPCPNLPTMAEFPLKSELLKHLSQPIYLSNDADCFAFGEWRWGAGRGTHVLLGVTLGTSIGLGIVFEGQLFRGAHGEAGEIWRSPTDLSSECSENLHSLLGGEAIEKLYQNTTGRIEKAAAISSAAVGGIEAAVEVFSRYARVLGRALCWLANIFDPDIIVLGGSISENYALIHSHLLEEFANTQVRIAQSQLGESAAILGAAAIAFTEAGGRHDE